MIKWYFFVITRDCNLFHSGYCKDVVKTVEKFKALPSMKPNMPKNSLIYLSEQRSKDDAYIEVNLFLMLTQAEKLAMIEEVNPTFLELIPGQNIEL